MKRSTTVAILFALFGLPRATSAQPLPGTAELTIEGDLSERMLAGVDRFLLRQIEQSVAARQKHWHRDLSSHANYETSVAPNRARLTKLLGVVDPREPLVDLEFDATTRQPALVGKGDGFDVFAVRWPVLAGITGEGLLLVPTREPAADVVVIPDADQTPEMLVGLSPGVAPESQFARRLAESGCRVVVPTLIDRADTLSVDAGGTRPTNQPHREFIYRPAFEMGRHVIGYEVQKVLALVDWFSARADESSPPIGVVGYGEGGLLALAAAALDTRIDAACVSGYFAPREDVWREPIYRNVFGLLHEFGDAELASLVAPRALIVEASLAPDVMSPPAERDGRRGAAPGKLVTPPLDAVAGELQRARGLAAGLRPPPRLELVANVDGKGPMASTAALAAFLSALEGELAEAGKPPTNLRANFDPLPRLRRQFDEMVAFTQRLVRESEYVRQRFWSKADRNSRSVERWEDTAQPYRDYFYDEVIGRFDLPRLLPNARTRRIFDEPKYTGYEVVLDVFSDVFAYGILLVPKGLKPGERRPVVVCQHGADGRPRDLADPNVESPYYHQLAVKLAERGFITYAPQNLYILADRFRTLQRKSNPLKKTLFSTIVPQHQQLVDWLGTLPMVDAGRIAFYGLSYGGKSAMRIPALVKDYCLSICSGDYNEWIWKTTSVRVPWSYVGWWEYEIFEFDLGQTFNYSEMTGLIAPRPFMVERGHRDGVGPDAWVAYEYAKAKLLYVDLRIPERTEIEYFDGPHEIHGVGTFEFLHKHLNWPEP